MGPLTLDPLRAVVDVQACLLVSLLSTFVQLQPREHGAYYIFRPVTGVIAAG